MVGQGYEMLVAAYENNAKKVESLLGVIVPADFKGYVHRQTAAHLAAYKGHKEVHISSKPMILVLRVVNDL